MIISLFEFDRGISFLPGPWRKYIWNSKKNQSPRQIIFSFPAPAGSGRPGLIYFPFVIYFSFSEGGAHEKISVVLGGGALAGFLFADDLQEGQEAAGAGVVPLY
jgi:hypothetical protein